MKYKIISVESRKGGVGKTTAALNLSRLLLEKGYTVLLIDIDITGTNVVDALDSSYWKEKINPIRYKKQYANLLQIYHDIFMQGLKLPRWRLRGNAENKVDFEISNFDINILGSEIYNKANTNESSNLIFNPSILFDELHAFWFVEYLQTICDTFAEKVSNDKIAIVLDNSPGFVGINPAIHEWLTNIGPIMGKFLTISSLDKQDLISCSRAIDNLHTLYQDKYIGAKKYSDIINNVNNKEFDLSGVSKNFYLRLASKNLSADANIYYDPRNIDKNNYTNKPQYYQAIIINKVPLEIKHYSISYNFTEIRDYTGNGEIMNKLLGNYNNKHINYLVYYDEYINLQFIESSLSRNRNKYRKQKFSNLKRNFSILEKTILKNRKETNYNDNLTNSNINYNIIAKNVKLYQQELDKLIEKFKVSNLRNIVRLIDIQWYPEYPFEILRQYFNELLTNYSYSNFEYESNFERDERMGLHFEKFIDQIERRIENNEISSYLYDGSIYSPSFKAVLYLTISPYLGDNHIVEELSDFVSTILNIQLERLLSAQLNEKEDFSIRKFLINDEIEEDTIDSKKFYRLFKRSNIHIRTHETFIIDFYNSFCKAQVRLIDIDEDFDFLIRVLRQITIDSVSNKQEILFPYIKDVLDKVILEKSTPHSRARKEIQKGFKSANYMTEFQNTLKKIIIKWEVA